MVARIKTRLLTYLVYVCLLPLLINTSCKDKNAKKGWETNVLTPIANTKVNIKDIIADSLLSYQPDSSLHLVYSNSIYEFDPTEELLTIPDTSLVNNLKLDTIVPLPPVGNGPSDIQKRNQQKVELFRREEPLVYNFNGPELTFFRVRSGELKIFITSTIRDTLYFDFRLNQARDQNGDSLTESDVLPPAPPNGNSTISRNFDLSGFEVDLRGPNQNSVNTIKPVIIGTVDSLGDLSDVTPQDSVYISYKLRDIVPRYVKGYLGQDTIEVGRESFQIDMFKNIQGELFELEKASADFTLTNGLGVEGELLLETFKAKRGTEELSLSSSVLNDPIQIKRGYDNPRIPNKTQVLLTQKNSNLTELMELFPTKFLYDIKAYINPNGNYFNYQDFGYYDSQFDINLDMEIPLQARLKDILLKDTTDFNIGLSDQDLKYIEKGKLNLITYNGFPYDIDVQLYLYDEMDNLTDSLFISNTIASGRFNDSCRVIDTKRTVLTSDISKDGLKRLQQAKKAIIRASFSNPETPSFCSQEKLKLYDDYSMELKLSASFKYLVEDAL